MTQSTLPGPTASTDDIRLQLRSWPEVEAYLERCKGVIVPLGSTEQHGPTGAIGTDALTAEAVAPVGPCCSVEPRGTITPLQRSR